MSSEQESVAIPTQPFRVGDWRVDASANEICRDDEVVKLEPKVMQVLCLLASRPDTPGTLRRFPRGDTG